MSISNVRASPIVCYPAFPSLIFLAKWEKTFSNSLASSLPHLSQPRKNLSRARIYAHGLGARIRSFPAHIVKRKKDRVLGEKNVREKDLVEGLKRVQKQIQGSWYKTRDRVVGKSAEKNNFWDRNIGNSWRWLFFSPHTNFRSWETLYFRE
jgi:hypothetical protein